MSYFNTNNLSGKELKSRNKKAETQDNIILNFFKGNPTKRFTPEEVLKETLLNAPLTSIRRSITNLTNKGSLVKTDIKVNGSYGAPVHKWELKTPKLF